MKLTLAFFLSTLAANAASVAFEWTPSTTPGATSTVYLSRSPLTNLVTAEYRYHAGTRTNGAANLSPGTWYLAVTARLEVESDPARLTVVVPASVTALREAPATAPRSRSTLPGHARQRNR